MYLCPVTSDIVPHLNCSGGDYISHHNSNPLCYVFSKCRRSEYSFKIFGLSLVFNDFC